LKNKLLREIIPISKLQKPDQITAPKGMTVLQGKIFQILAKIHPLQITHFLKSSSTMVGAQ
jgi:hypothetical protein